MPRSKTTPKDSDKSPSFEEAIEGLETIVEAMENEQLPLEELVAYYEKGSKLVGRCESILQSARDRIELITLQQQDDTKPASTAAGRASAPTTAPDHPGEPEHDDIRLL